MPAEAARTPDRVSLLKPTAVNSVLAEMRALSAQGKQIVSLMRGEPDFRTPEHIIEAAAAALRAGRTTYPDNRGEMPLRQAIADKLGRENGLSYAAASEILVTDGATLGIYAALMALLDPGDEILVPDPIYDAYQSPIRLAGACARLVQSSFKNGRFGIATENLEAACNENTRALLLNTPWNPVGTVFTGPELAEIADFVVRRKLTLISDEIYEHITYDDHRHVSPAAVSPAIRERCVIVNSLSKTYAMTGWRLGYCAAQPELVQRMLLILQQSSRGPAMFIQDAGVAALSGPQECVERMRTIYAERRDLTVQSLSGLPSIDVLPPEGGFFAMIDAWRSGRESDDLRRRLLHDHGVAVMHGRAYGEGGEGMLRVSFAAGGETLQRGLGKLREGLSAL
jgi:aspartate/methionine/tyrosine aminotransferase